MPDTGTQLEIVRAHDAARVSADRSDQLVFYLAGPEAVEVATKGLSEAGVVPINDAHRYWAANNALVYLDPDGRGVVYAPWVYGREPEPSAPPVEISWYDGDRAAIRYLFKLADDSAMQVDSYIDKGRVLLARRGLEPVGHLQLMPAKARQDVELKSLAVVADERGNGIGRMLVARAVAEASADGSERMLVSTAATDTGNLRFYQRCGFRLLSVDRDAFTPEKGYPEAMLIDGVELRDRVWLDRSIRYRISQETLGRPVAGVCLLSGGDVARTSDTWVVTAELTVA